MNNRTMIQYFEWYLPADGLLWNMVKNRSKELANNGFTTIWLPPASKGMNGINDVGYGTYDLYDLGEFDQKGSVVTKYGSKNDYIEAIKALQANGLTVLADMVFNHKMGADEAETVSVVETAADNREQIVSERKDITAWTKFTFPGRNGKYSDFTWNKSHFSGCDYDDNTKKSALYLFEGKSWNRETDTEHVNFDYLMGADLDMDNSEVCEELLNFTKWFLDTTGVNGFRLDAVKHISASFYKNWIEKLRKLTGQALPTVGEYWSGDVNHLLNYLNEVNDDLSLFDVPLHYNFFNAASAGGGYNMSEIFNNTLVSTKPDKAILFVDNHDTQPGQALKSFVDNWFKPLAYAIILLTDKGIPCVFYGDYYGIPTQNTPPVNGLKRLIKIRQLYAYGKENDYFDNDNIVGFTREGDAKHKNSGLAVILSDNAGGTKRMYINKAWQGVIMRDACGKCQEEVCIDAEGYGNFRVDGGSVSVWLTKEAYIEISNSPYA